YRNTVTPPFDIGRPPGPANTDGREAPPSGPPWDLPVEEAPFALVDLEMTGLDTDKDRVIEICVERQKGGRTVGRLETLVDPGQVDFATDVHGIDRSALVGAPSFDRVADRVLELFEGAVPVAHAASWDIAFLESELAHAGRPARFPFFLDTLTLSRRA